ncbi:hypothetical protein XI03_33010 [Bradyrhizobium sp. CCBAU 65884]|nr:hypothetical protein [Bradyrhizobium sp. CCBAU 65884]
MQDIGIEQITFRNYFFAFAAPATNLLFAKFTSLRFEDCAIGIYSRGFERCYLDALSAQGTGCVVAIGGQWCSRSDEYNEGGGFSDKTYFGVIHNIYQRVMGEAEAAIDQYFDRVFYKTQNETMRLGPPARGRSIVRSFRYLGLCGRAVYLMSRYGRPNNANTFRLISHAYAHRAALWIEAAIACTAEVIYLERCGYQDNVRRTGPIGVSFVDPFLGPKVRIPAFVKGANCQIDAQQVVCDKLAIGNEFTGRFTYASDVAFPNNFHSIKDNLIANSLSTWSEPAGSYGLTLVSFELEPNSSVELEEKLGRIAGPRAAAVIFASVRQGSEAAIYLVSFDRNPARAGQSALLGGTDLLHFVKGERGQILVRSRMPEKRMIASIWAH